MLKHLTCLGVAVPCRARLIVRTLSHLCDSSTALKKEALGKDMSMEMDASVRVEEVSPAVYIAQRDGIKRLAYLHTLQDPGRSTSLNCDLN